MGKAWGEGESMEDVSSGFVRGGGHEFSTGMPSLFVIVLSPISEPKEVQHSNLIQLNRATLSSGHPREIELYSMLIKIRQS
jgi:hypothetical protein